MWYAASARSSRPSRRSANSQIARGARHRRGGVEALIDRAGAPPSQALDAVAAPAPALARDAAGVAAAGGHVDRHAEQVLRGLGENLGQAHGALRAAGGHRVRRPALSRNTRPSSRSGSTFAWRAARSTSGRHRAVRMALEEHAAGRVGVQRVARPPGGPAHEVLAALGVPRERVRDRLELPVGRRRGDELDPGARLLVAAQHERDRDDSERQAREHGESAHPHHPSRATLPPCDASSQRPDSSWRCSPRPPTEPSPCASSASTASGRPARRRG